MMVSVRGANNNHLCGGTILSNSYILTAAHCLYDYASNALINIAIAAGMTNILDSEQIQRSVDRIYIHPRYIDSQDGNRHDIALLHVNKSFLTEHNPLLTRTCIHRVSPPIVNNQYITNGTRLTVIGWGVTEHGLPLIPTILQQVEVFAIHNDDPICTSSMNDSERNSVAGLPEGGKGKPNRYL